MENISTLKDLFAELLGDLYNAEVLEIDELNAFAHHAEGQELQESIRDHVKECRAHLLMIEDIMEQIDHSLLDDHCRTMRSLIQEAQTLVKRCEAGPIRNFAIIVSLHRISECKASMYRMLMPIADYLAESGVTQKLRKCLEDEVAFKDVLTSKFPTTLTPN